MIGRIQGTLVSVHPPRLLVDCQGIGYEVDVPMSTLYQLPQAGQKITLLTHFQVREDAQQLFGFATETEREAFRQLIKISGVGSRTALAVLSGMSVNELAQAIALQESGRLTQVPGIGKKTAERLLLELRDLVRSGKLGKITMARTWWHGNGYHLRKAPASLQSKPSNLDWARFLGPVKWRDYDPQQYFNFRAYLDFGGGQVTDLFTHWIDVGQPDERRIMKASPRAERVTVISFSHSTPVWWKGLETRITRARNVAVWQVEAEQSHALAALAQRHQVDPEILGAWLDPFGQCPPRG